MREDGVKMGLYDEFVTQGLGVHCPKCGAQLSSLQSKSLPDPFLTQYQIGDELQMETLEGLAKLEIRDGRLVCYTSCQTCRAWSNWHAIISDNRWVAIELADWHELPAAARPSASVE